MREPADRPDPVLDRLPIQEQIDRLHRAIIAAREGKATAVDNMTRTSYAAVVTLGIRRYHDTLAVQLLMSEALRADELPGLRRRLGLPS